MAVTPRVVTVVYRLQLQRCSAIMYGAQIHQFWAQFKVGLLSMCTSLISRPNPNGKGSGEMVVLSQHHISCDFAHEHADS